MKIQLDQAPPTHFDFMIFWRNLPFFFKLILPFTYIFALLEMFTELPTFIFANYAIKTLQHGQVWRIITAPIISLGMLHYTICMINLYYILPRLQKTYSTIFIIVDFVVQNIIIQSVYTLIIGIAYDFTSSVQNWFSAGLWNMLMLYLVRICYALPNSQIQMCCMPFKLRTTYYPFIMLIIYNIFTLPLVEIDIYITFIWAILQSKCASGNFFKYSPRCLIYLQRKLFKLIGERTDITKLSDRSKLNSQINGSESALNTIKQQKQSQISNIDILTDNTNTEVH